MSTPDRSQLPYLLALLDDKSGVVRDSVLGKLAEFGESLEAELQGLPDPPSDLRVRRLVAALDQHRARVQEFYQESSEGTVIRSVLFQPGDLVRHRRYGYLGLVVDRDLSCHADQDWYLRNRSQPDQRQPWYHVLVDGSDAVTYAAQTSLLPDESGAEIRHGLVTYFFERIEDGHYVRNATDWPHQA